MYVYYIVLYITSSLCTGNMTFDTTKLNRNVRKRPIYNYLMDRKLHTTAVVKKYIDIP